MFNKRINELTLVSGIADGFFRQIQGEGYKNDLSFLATLRALLYKRIPSEARGVYLSISRSTYGADTLRTATSEALFNAIFGTERYSDRIVLHTLESDNDGISAAFEKFDNAIEGFAAIRHCRDLNDLRQFSQAKVSLNARFYIDEEARCMYIVAADLDIRKYHFIQSMIPRYTPWYFKDVPLNEEETALLTSLMHRYATEYEMIMTAIGDRIDFRDHVIKSIIGDFEKSGRQKEMESVQRSISEARAKLQQHMDAYARTCDALNDLNTRLSGMEVAMNSMKDESELIEYFCCNKSIEPTQAADNKLAFTVKTYLESYDEEVYRTYYRNKASAFYTGYRFLPEFESIETRRKMLDAIFADDPKLKILMCANYIIHLTRGVNAQSGYSYGAEFADYVPNPHIQKFSCIGNYTQYINRYIQEGNIIAAVEQCIASAKSLNMTEAFAIRWVMDELFGGRRRIIELPDKRHVTPLEALEYLNAVEANMKEDE